MLAQGFTRSSTVRREHRRTKLTRPCRPLRREGPASQRTVRGKTGCPQGAGCCRDGVGARLSLETELRVMLAEGAPHGQESEVDARQESEDRGAPPECLRTPANAACYDHGLQKRTTYRGLPVVQWLRLHTPKSGSPGSIPDRGTSNRSHKMQLRPSAAKNKYTF